MKSIMQVEKECYICGRNGNGDPLEMHHIFEASNRKHSEEDGLKVWLCGNRCHRNGPQAVHKNHYTDTVLKQVAQTVWEDRYGNREQFVARYGKNYL